MCTSISVFHTAKKSDNGVDLDNEAIQIINCAVWSVR